MLRCSRTGACACLFALLTLSWQYQGASADVFDSIGNAISSVVDEAKAVLDIGDDPDLARAYFITNNVTLPLLPTNDTVAQFWNYNTSTADPTLYKTADALAYAQLAEVNATSNGTFRLDAAQLLAFGNGSRVLVAWVDNQTAVLAFHGDNASYEALTTNASARLVPVPFLQDFILEASANPDALNPVQEVLGNASASLLRTTIQELSNNATPVAVHVTGLGSGGAFGVLGALWAAVTYPSAYIRSITFNAPPVGNNELEWAYLQLTDLSYLWTGIMNGSNPHTLHLEYNLTNINTTAADAQVGQDVGFFINAFRDALSNNSASKIELAPPPTFEFDASLSDVAEAIQQIIEKGFGGDENENSTRDEPYRSPPAPEACPLMLCKIRDAADQSCRVYNFTNNYVSPVSIIVNPGEYDAGAAVGWDAATRTAYFVFRGTTSLEGWIQDAKISQESFAFPTKLQDLYSGVEVHKGFYQQFQSTVDATNASYNLANILANISINAVPLRVVATGHSLGAALGTIAGMWAAEAYPGADVLTVTMGSPQLGNAAFTQVFRALVGRQYRIIHQQDQVPALPPKDSYLHVGWPLWQRNQTQPAGGGNRTVVAVEARPYKPIEELTWEDHGCQQYVDALFAVPNVTVPAAVNASNI